MKCLIILLGCIVFEIATANESRHQTIKIKSKSILPVLENSNNLKSQIPNENEWLELKKNFNLSKLEDSTPFENGYALFFKDFFTNQTSEWKVKYKTNYGYKIITEMQTSQAPYESNYLWTQASFLIYRGELESGEHLVVRYDGSSMSIAFNSEMVGASEMAQSFRRLVQKKQLEHSVYLGKVLELKANSRNVGFYEGVDNYKYNWGDLILNPELKNNLKITIDNFLNNYNLKDWEKYGLPLNRGVLIYGPPGTGKSFISKVLVGNVLNKRYKNIVSYIHVQARHISSEGKIRDLYNAARMLSPCIIFFEDIDLIAGAGRFDRPDVKNELMQQLSGVESLKGVITIGTTNYFNAIDSALKRTKRLGYHFYIGLPSIVERESLLKGITSKFLLDDPSSLSNWSLKTEGFTGADLREVIDLTAEEALRSQTILINEKSLTLKPEHFETALMKKIKYQPILKPGGKL